MIIREHDYIFVMIEQHHHAQISAEIMGKWRDYLFHHDPLYKSVMYAIEQHDCGWRFFDEQPFWNDAEQAPYAFTNFPTMAKSVLYTKGIDEVEALDPYAAVLCSAHYTKFLEKSEHREARRFVEREKLRRERILSQLEIESMNIVDQHLALLQFADNISLYLCLNEPGAKKEAEHYFFKGGIPVSQILKHTISEIVQAYWHGEQQVILEGLPSIPSFPVFLQQKHVKKQDIHEMGLLKAYESTPYRTHEIRLQVNE